MCPLCDGPSRRLFMAEGYWIRGCLGCEHRFAELSPTAEHVREVYDDGYFQGGGAGYHDYVEEAELLRARGRFYGEVLQGHIGGGTVLDVGAAAGFILLGMMDVGFQGEGIEPNQSMASYARKRLDVPVRVATIEDLPVTREYDAILLVQILPHLYDLHRGVRNVASLLRPGGCCLIETWDREGVTARTLGRRWHEYSPPSVLHWFSERGVRRLGERHGLVEVERLRPPRRISIAHAMSLAGHKARSTAIGRAAVALSRRVPERLSIPYPCDDLMLVVLRRAGDEARLQL